MRRRMASRSRGARLVMDEVEHIVSLSTAFRAGVLGKGLGLHGLRGAVCIHSHKVAVVSQSCGRQADAGAVSCIKASNGARKGQDTGTIEHLQAK